jgi:hypothetical protein
MPIKHTSKDPLMGKLERRGAVSRTVTGFVIAILSLLAIASADGGRALTLKYQFKPGETYVYAMTIIADRGDATETFKGHVELAVKAANGTEIRIVPTVNLGRELKRKQPGGFPPPLPPLPPGPPSFLGSREVSFDPYGNVVRSAGDPQLSYLLGSAAQMIIEPLSPEGKSTWQRGTDLVIRQSQRMGPFFFKGPPGSETNLTARETMDFEATEGAAGSVRIKKKYELKTLIQAGDAPRLHLTGAGEIAFDTKLGLPTALDYKATLVQNEDNVTIRVPIQVTHRLLGAEEVAALRKQLEESRAKAIEAAKKAAEPQPITDAQMSKALEDIKSTNFFTARNAADKLGKAIPIEVRRAEVAAGLEQLATADNAMLRSEAAKALKTWATPKSAATLLVLLKDQNIFARNHAMEALGVLKDPQAAEALAALVPELRSRMAASAALKTMGPAGQKAVVPLLKHQDWVVRLEAVRILAASADRDALPAVQAAASDSNRLVANEAAKAVKVIEGR